MTSIFVAKLDFGVTEEELKGLFDQFGRVNKAHIAKDKETGKPRGFAFVEMEDSDAAQKAIEALDGHSINGRTIAVKEADQRGAKPQNDRPSYGNRNGSTQGNDRSFKSDRSDNTAGRFVPRSNDRPIESNDGFNSNPVSFELPKLEDLNSINAKKGKKSKPSEADDFASKKKKHKMDAHKKSGKSNNRFFYDDEDGEW